MVFVSGPSAAVVVAPPPRSLPAFGPYGAQLSTRQRQEIARFARDLERGDVVRCVVYSPSPTLVSRILLRRAEAACAEIRRVARGVRASPAVEPMPTRRQMRKWGVSADSLARRVMMQKDGVGERRFG